MTLKLDLPDIDNSIPHSNDLEDVLISLRDQIEGKYDDYIKVPITTSVSQSIMDKICWFMPSIYLLSEKIISAIV